MTGFPVEFVDDDAPREIRAATVGAAYPTRRRQSVVRALWALAAALTALACFQNIFSYRFTSGAIRSRGGYNATGRALDRQLATDHGPRYAVLLGLCVALFAVLVVVRSEMGNTSRWILRHVAALGLVSTTLLAGTLAGIGLGIESSFATYRALAASLRAAGNGSEIAMSIGACLWIGLAALGCAVVAMVVSTSWCRSPGSDARTDEDPMDAATRGDQHHVDATPTHLRRVPEN